MSDSVTLTDVLDRWHKEINDQIEVVEDEDLSSLIPSREHIVFCIKDAKELSETVAEASRTLNLLALDSLQLDLRETQVTLVKQHISELLELTRIILTNSVCTANDELIAKASEIGSKIRTAI